MVLYRVIVDRTLCIACVISTGRCPTHARVLSRILNKNQEDTSMGVFPEDLYPRVKQIVEACPVKAIIIEKIEE